ncbi:hypothetical protein [Beduini massiliensis]|uniref:hypothetical protein n=1 Tax=Beduini massiliensis TaxID=1585974 RepID=UPI00059AA7F1|nr:hypothetical protein [Beduini massiliensis]
MGTFKFSLKMLRLDFKKCFFYGLSLVLSTSIIFVFFNYIDNIYLGNSLSEKSGANQILALFIIIIACANACFANSFFISRKTNEIAIASMSGASVFAVAGYLLVQNFVIMGLSIPIGFGIGYIFNHFFNLFIYASLDVVANTYYVSMQGLIMSTIVILTQIIALTLVNSGYAYRTEIKTLLNEQESMTKKSTKPIKTPVIFYWILYLIPIVLFFIVDLDPMVFVVVSCIGVFGIVGLLKIGLSKLIMFRQKSHLTKSNSLIAYGNLSYSLKSTGMLMTIIILSIILFIGLIIININNPKDLFIVLLSYGIIIFLMSTSILYKIILETSTRLGLYQSLFKLGYLKKQLKAIMRKEIMMLYGVILFFPTSYIVIMLSRFVIAGEVAMSFAAALVLAYVIPICITALIAYFVYKRTIIANI